MGKITILFIAAMLASQALASTKPRLARVLPSQVKTISFYQQKHAQKKAAPTKKKAAIVQQAELSSELQAEADENPFASKFFSRSIYFVRSDYQLPAEYDCDEATQERKRQDAENEAQMKCQTSGMGDCRIAKTVISKVGVLRCSDFPGRKCPGSGHFRGCVAETLVLGER